MWQDQRKRAKRGRERASENLDLKYKVNGDLLLLIRTDLPCGNTSSRSSGYVGGRGGCKRDGSKSASCVS